MFQPGERTTAVTVSSRLAGHIRLRLLLIADELRVGSPELTRIGLIALGLALIAVGTLTPGHFRPTDIAYFPFQVVMGTLGSLVAVFAATLSLRQVFGTWVRQTICGIGLVVVIALPVLGVVSGGPGFMRMIDGAPYGNDGAIMDLYAAQQVLHGHDPYLRTNIVLALASINAPAITTTPLQDGQFRDARAYPSESAVEQAFLNVLKYRPRTVPPEFESKYNYPAGAFLAVLPFAWAGLYDMRVLYILALVLMAAYVWFHTSRALRPIIPILFLANVPMVLNAIGGQPDPIYALFLMIGLAEWPRRRVSPLAMGLAVATKQLAWFFAPFYLILVVRKLGWREGARRAGLMALVFLAVNLPFILQSPSGYIDGLSAPMFDPMFPLGLGLVALFSSNLLPMWPKMAFTVIEGATWLGGVSIFARLRTLPIASIPVLAMLPLFFAWRSLDNYFYLVPFLVLAIALAESTRSLQSPHPVARSTP